MFVKKETEIGHNLIAVLHEANHVDYRANKSSIYTVAPKIISEYLEDDLRMYECEGDRRFVADTYDRFFKVDKSEVMPKRYKGENPYYKNKV